MIEQIVPSSDVTEEKISANCKVYKADIKGGDGMCIVYTVLPGITVTYNDFHTDEIAADFNYAGKVVSIDHCSEGRIEWEHDDGSFLYLCEHDVQVSVKLDHANRYGFPTGHYHGITVNFFVDDAALSLKELFPMFDANPYSLWQKYSVKKDFFLQRTEKDVQRIFSDLYKNRKNIEIDYLRIKIIELLYILTKIEPNNEGEEKPYFPKAQVEKVRKIKKHLCENTDMKITLQQLSNEFDISLTGLQRCFKSMYGQSVHAFVKQFRIQKAANLLTTTNLSVTEISLETGYENPSKFITAFKAVYGKTPLKYRNK